MCGEGSQGTGPDPRICERCPVERGDAVCVRCEVDTVCVAKRKVMIAEAGPFVHRGVDYGPALEYWLLHKILPEGDPVEGIR